MEVTEHGIRVAKSARYFTLLEDRAQVRELWYLLHGYGQLAHEFLEEFAQLARPYRCLVAPEALSRFYLRSGTGRVGASWMTREQREPEIEDYLAYLDAVHAELGARFGGSVGAVHVLGFSQGAASAFRFGTSGLVRPVRLILWGGEVPPEVDLERLRPRLSDVELVCVAGTSDEAFDGERVAAQEARLAAAGLRFRCIRFAGGHRLDGEVLRQLGERVS